MGDSQSMASGPVLAQCLPRLVVSLLLGVGVASFLASKHVALHTNQRSDGYSNLVEL